MLRPPAPPAPAIVPEVGFREALGLWLKLGFISFGGPAGQIAIMHKELVEDRKWIPEERFVHGLQFCMLLPGPEAQQLATWVGWTLHGRWGGLAAGGLFVLPSIFILLGLSALYVETRDLGVAIGVLGGFKAVVVAIIVHALHRLGRSNLRSAGSVAIAVASFVALHLLGVAYPAVVIGAIVVGLVAARWRGAASPAEDAPVAEVGAGAGIRTGGRPGRLLLTLALLWSVPLALLAAWRGQGSLHVDEYIFFSQAALVTFGGAYAVLSYGAGGATERFGWISAAQAADGLALAETTPGPLIMVVQFVGFLAAWNHPGDLPVWVAAVLGAAVTTWVTFLPSFGLVFLGAPYIDRLRGNPYARAAFGAVTAAVLGAILHLALLLAGAAFAPGGAVDPAAITIAVLAFLALWRRKAGVALVVAGGGLAGLLRYFVGIGR